MNIPEPTIADLEGEWIAHYEGNTLPSETHKISFNAISGELECHKITGNKFIPAGALSWRWKPGTEYGHGSVASEESEDILEVPISVVGVLGSIDRLLIYWVCPDKVIEVDYRKDE